MPPNTSRTWQYIKERELLLLGSSWEGKSFRFLCTTPNITGAWDGTAWSIFGGGATGGAATLQGTRFTEQWLLTLGLVGKVTPSDQVSLFADWHQPRALK